MNFARINSTGRANLIAWLVGNLKSGTANAAGHADALIRDFNGADPETRTLDVELRSFHARSGNPVTYSFAREEYDVVEVDEDGNDVAGQPYA